MIEVDAITASVYFADLLQLTQRLCRCLRRLIIFLTDKPAIYRAAMHRRMAVPRTLKRLLNGHRSKCIVLVVITL